MIVNNLISLNNICKSYGENKVLQDLEFSISRGASVAILGKNGAGKSTLLKIIAGLIKNFSGRFEKSNFSLSALIETPVFIDGFSGLDNIEYILGKKLVPKVTEIASSLGLSDYMHKAVRKYSLGMRQKLALAIVFATNADLVLLDEPFNSLDFESTGIVLDLINTLRESAKSVIIVTHNISRINEYCDKILVLENGLLNEQEIDIGILPNKYCLTFIDEQSKKMALNLLGDCAIDEIGATEIVVNLTQEYLPIVIKRLVDCSLIGVVKTSSKSYNSEENKLDD
ncbi:MAG: ABC transporter ATP-binding protein [Christensenellaceae bacterium]|jgi:ABC-2 type transport system ATP-binding protein|nr:ABC transporter ATP-binding protein [Christensenellaceae bacterium]